MTTKETINSVLSTETEAPGIGVYTTPTKWCYKCDKIKPLKNGTNKNKMFKCADCQPVKLAK